MTASPISTERQIFSVADLLAGVRGLLEDRVGRVWVVGEVSNLFRASSGHVYFTLKDSRAQVRAAFFRSAAKRATFELEEGLEVLVWADATVYEPRGDLQLIVKSVEPRGQGALQLALEQLRRRLEAEGLFDEQRKRALPEFPRRIAVVTSPVGAAVRDVIHVTGRRFPATPLLIVPTRVQGEGAEEEIAAALDAAGQQRHVDLVLLVRGGGSLEDLWSFNTEIVARAIARCPCPVVSGVGHEVDFSIADAVADARAATPSSAAALALPDRSSLWQRLERCRRALVASAQGHVERSRARLSRERAALRVLAPSARLAARRARLDSAIRGQLRGIQGLIGRRRSQLATLAGRLDSLSPLAVLGRGYALVRSAETRAIVRASGEVHPGDRISIRLARAEIDATVVVARDLGGIEERT